MQVMQVRPALADSYERLCHEAELPAFSLQLREPAHEAVRYELAVERLERAIGVVYRPETERQSHYFAANLVNQFDQYVWFDQTSSVRLLGPVRERSDELPDTYPFGL
jgi:erythromycin esterase-like protein